MISYTVWSGYANYVDPIMSIILCLGLLYEPLKIVWGSFQDLVDARPDDEANERIEAMVRRMAEKYPSARHRLDKDTQSREKEISNGVL